MTYVGYDVCRKKFRQTMPVIDDWKRPAFLLLLALFGIIAWVFIAHPEWLITGINWTMQRIVDFPKN